MAFLNGLSKYKCVILTFVAIVFFAYASSTTLTSYSTIRGGNEGVYWLQESSIVAQTIAFGNPKNICGVVDS